MLTRIAFGFMLCFLFSTNVLAETYIREYTYNASELDSKVTSRTNAVDQLKVILLQEIGTHIRQKLDITKDSEGKVYAKENIEAITAGLTKVDIIEEKWNGETFYVKASIEADTSRVLNALEEFKKNKSAENKQQVEELKYSQRKLKVARKEIADLKVQLKQVINKPEKERLVKQYARQVEQVSISEIFFTAYNYYQKGQFEDAFYWYRKAAEQGMALAQFTLGYMYGSGEGVVKDDEKALYWYRKAYSQGLLSLQFADEALTVYWLKKAAEQGYVETQTYLGHHYTNDILGRKLGRKTDNKKGIYWFRKAAEQGYAEAQFSLALVLLGYRTEEELKDPERAVYWIKKAAEQGHISSQNLLAGRYKYGSEASGVKKDYEKAIYWYQKAAEQGDERSQRDLAKFYIDIKEDYNLGVHWYKKAAEQGDMIAQYELGLIYIGDVGIKNDYEQAVYWFRKAADQGYKKAEQLMKAAGISKTPNKDWML